MGAAAAGVGKQRQPWQQARSGGLALLGQSRPSSQDRLQLRIAPVGRQQAGLQIEGPAGLHHDRVAGAGSHAGGQVEQHRQLAARHRPVGQGLDQGLFIGGLDGPAPQHIEPGHQTRLLEVERVLQYYQVVAQVGVVDAHKLLVLLELVIGLTHLQLQGAQLVGIGVALLLQAGPGRFHRGRAGKVEQGVVELQAPFDGPCARGGCKTAAVGYIKGTSRRARRAV